MPSAEPAVRLGGRRGARTRHPDLVILVLALFIACAAAGPRAGSPGRREFLAGDFAAAEDALRAAVAACQATGDARCELANSINLGLCQRALEELPQAEATLERSMQLAQLLKLRSFEAGAASNLANVLLAEHRYPEALAKARAAASLADIVRIDALRIDARGILALAMVAQGNSGGALAVAQEAETLARQGPGRAAMAGLAAPQLTLLGGIRRRLGDCPRAEELLHRAIAGGERGTEMTMVDAHVGLARCARKRGDGTTERSELKQARALWQTRDRRLEGRAQAAWRRQTLYLQAAELEAFANPSQKAGAGPGLSYAMAVLYESDGDPFAELRALLQVPEEDADGGAAERMAAALLERMRVVTGNELPLRESPDEQAAVSRRLHPGTWVEVVRRLGGWLKVRTEIETGFLEDAAEIRRSLRRIEETRPPGLGESSLLGRPRRRRPVEGGVVAEGRKDGDAALRYRSRAVRWLCISTKPPAGQLSAHAPCTPPRSPARPAASSTRRPATFATLLGLSSC